MCLQHSWGPDLRCRGFQQGLKLEKLFALNLLVEAVSVSSLGSRRQRELLRAVPALSSASYSRSARTSRQHRGAPCVSSVLAALHRTGSPDVYLRAPPRRAGLSSGVAASSASWLRACLLHVFPGTQRLHASTGHGSAALLHLYLCPGQGHGTQPPPVGATAGSCVGGQDTLSVGLPSGGSRAVGPAMGCISGLEDEGRKDGGWLEAAAKWCCSAFQVGMAEAGRTEVLSPAPAPSCLGLPPALSSGCAASCACPRSSLTLDAPPQLGCGCRRVASTGKTYAHIAQEVPWGLQHEG